MTFADGVTGKTTMHGNIGSSTAITGTDLGYVNFIDGKALGPEEVADFASGVPAALAAALAKRGGDVTELSGNTFTPGVYHATSTIGFSGAGTFTTLDGQGDENAVFLFNAVTAMTTAANTYFVLKNGAKAENVLFALGSAATLGANSVIQGSIIVGTSVTVGIGAQVNGCIIASTAAITYEGLGGTTGNSALVFDDTGSNLEHCQEPTSAPSVSPTTSPTSAPKTGSSKGDPHCKYQRFGFIFLLFRSFV
jgi:hypothetical protein